MFGLPGLHEEDFKGFFSIKKSFITCFLKDYKLPPNLIMSRDLERKIDLIVDFLKKYGIVDEGIFTFIKTMKVFSCFALFYNKF